MLIMLRFQQCDIVINGIFIVLVPFDEDDKDRSVWFLDHDYLENMYHMFKKVNGELCDFEMFHAMMDICG